MFRSKVLTDQFCWAVSCRYHNWASLVGTRKICRMCVQVNRFNGVSFNWSLSAWPIGLNHSCHDCSMFIFNFNLTLFTSYEIWFPYSITSSHKLKKISFSSIGLVGNWTRFIEYCSLRPKTFRFCWRHVCQTEYHTHRKDEKGICQKKCKLAQKCGEKTK